MTGGKGGALHKIQAREGEEVMGESRTRRGTTPAILERSVGGTSTSGAGKYVRRHGKARREIGAKGVASGASKQRCWWGRQE
jgi:hypothetical protein